MTRGIDAVIPARYTAVIRYVAVSGRSVQAVVIGPRTWRANVTPAPHRRRRCPAWVGCAALCSVALAACGSTSHPAKSAVAGDRFLAFSQCMRAHGVTNFPDPSSSGGIQLSASSGINPFSPAFKAAQGACRSLLPGGGPSSAPSAAARAQLLRVSECMRAHGVTGFPDPTTTPPAGPSGYSLVLGHGGVFLEVPATINPTTPTFRRAAAACHFG